MVKIKKGQVGAEAMISALIIFILFVMIVGITISYDSTSDAISTSWGLWNECSRISAVVSGVGASGDGSAWSGETEFNVWVGQGYVAVAEPGTEPDEGALCSHTAEFYDEILYYGGAVSFENIGGTVYGT